MSKLLIFGVGNPGRGDDALGPLVAAHIESIKLQRQWHHVDVLTAYQLQIEHVMDMADYEITLFVDAHTRCSRPYQVDRCQAESDQSYTTHALTPDALLAVYQQAFKKPPPPCYFLSIKGESFELGQSLSKSASYNLELAIKFVVQLCQQSENTEILDAGLITELSYATA